MKDELNRPQGATPVDDISGLKPNHISTKQELDLWEAENILKAARKYLAKRRKITFNEQFVRKLHREMFSDTWEWAGRYRTSDFNIGVPSHLITGEIAGLCGDYDYRVKNGFDFFEIVLMVHHRLVQIHPFVNGNGRHARLMGDILLYSTGSEPVKWPDREMVENTDVRKQYIEALKEADKGDYNPLKEFTLKYR